MRFYPGFSTARTPVGDHLEVYNAGHEQTLWEMSNVEFRLFYQDAGD